MRISHISSLLLFLFLASLLSTSEARLFKKAFAPKHYPNVRANCTIPHQVKDLESYSPKEKWWSGPPIDPFSRSVPTPGDTIDGPIWCAVSIAHAARNLTSNLASDLASDLARDPTSRISQYLNYYADTCKALMNALSERTILRMREHWTAKENAAFYKKSKDKERRRHEKVLAYIHKASSFAYREAARQIKPYCDFLANRAQFPSAPAPKNDITSVLTRSYVQGILTNVIPKGMTSIKTAFVHFQGANAADLHTHLTDLQVATLIRATTSTTHLSSLLPSNSSLQPPPPSDGTPNSILPHPNSLYEVKGWNVDDITSTTTFAILTQATLSLTTLACYPGPDFSIAVELPLNTLPNYLDSESKRHRLRTILPTIRARYQNIKGSYKRSYAPNIVARLGKSSAVKSVRAAYILLSFTEDLGKTIISKGLPVA